MSDVADRIERAVLLIHRFNGGKLSRLNLKCRLADPGLLLDPADVGQVIAAIERAFGCSLRRRRRPIETWQDLVEHVERLTRISQRNVLQSRSRRSEAAPR